MLDDSDAESVADLCVGVEFTGHVWAAYVRVPRLVFGAKRNRGMALATGQICANWDDDDWSAPGRLMDQVERLVLGHQAVTGYHNMRFTDGPHWWFYDGAAGFALDTSLAYWRAWGLEHPYPVQQLGADGVFIRGAAQLGQLSTVPGGDLMWASVHEGNTSPRKVGTGCYRECEAPCLV